MILKLKANLLCIIISLLLKLLKINMFTVYEN